MREDEIQRIAAEAARRVLGKNLTAIDGGAPPSPLPSDSGTDIPEKLEPFQGRAKYARWYRQIVCTLGAHMSEKLNDMLAKGSFEPNCGANCGATCGAIVSVSDDSSRTGSFMGSCSGL